MDRYIHEDTLLKTLEGYTDMTKADLLDILEDIPTADVEEVRHGEWEFRGDGRYGQTRCYCSVCGKHSGIGGIRANQ